MGKDKASHPTDVHRREERKKELKRNKKIREEVSSPPFSSVCAQTHCWKLQAASLSQSPTTHSAFTGDPGALPII